MTWRSNAGAWIRSGSDSGLIWIDLKEPNTQKAGQQNACFIYCKYHKKTQGRPWWGGDHICIYIYNYIYTYAYYIFTNNFYIVEWILENNCFLCKYHWRCCFGRFFGGLAYIYINIYILTHTHIYIIIYIIIYIYMHHFQNLFIDASQ